MRQSIAIQKLARNVVNRSLLFGRTLTFSEKLFQNRLLHKTKCQMRISFIYRISFINTFWKNISWMLKWEVVIFLCFPTCYKPNEVTIIDEYINQGKNHLKQKKKISKCKIMLLKPYLMCFSNSSTFQLFVNLEATTFSQWSSNYLSQTLAIYVFNISKHSSDQKK